MHKRGCDVEVCRCRSTMGEPGMIGLKTSVKEIEKEKELEKDIEKEIDIYESIRSLYHSYCKSYPHCPSLTEAHKQRIDYLMQTYNLGDFVTMFKKAEASRFLKGENDRKWAACLGWMIKDNNMQKILNGEYD